MPPLTISMVSFLFVIIFSLLNRFDIGLCRVLSVGVDFFYQFFANEGVQLFESFVRTESPDGQDAHVEEGHLEGIFTIELRTELIFALFSQ